MIPVQNASVLPEGYGGPVFPFELNAKSMIVTDDAAKPLKLVRWWDDLPRVSASDNAEAVMAPSIYLAVMAPSIYLGCHDAIPRLGAGFGTWGG